MWPVFPISASIRFQNFCISFWGLIRSILNFYPWSLWKLSSHKAVVASLGLFSHSWCRSFILLLIMNIILYMILYKRSHSNRKIFSMVNLKLNPTLICTMEKSFKCDRLEGQHLFLNKKIELLCVFPIKFPGYIKL